MKIRLYRGPFDGKVMEWDGGRDVMLAGPKKMTRKQRYAQFAKATTHDNLMFTHVTARYVRTTFVHPDGSVFYEWDKPRGG